MSAQPQDSLQRNLFMLALAIGAVLSVGSDVVFAVALHRPLDPGEAVVTVINAFLAAIPFMYLASVRCTRILPWLIILAASAWLQWWWVSKGIAYQRSPDGSGVDMAGALLMLVSPIPLTGIAWAAHRVSRPRGGHS